MGSTLERMEQMSDLLERTPVSNRSEQARAATGLDAWAANATPVTAPPGRSEPYEALLSTFAGLSGWTLVHRNTTASVTGATVAEQRLGTWSGPSVHPGTVALDDLQGWLSLSLDELVRLVGLSPSARAWWRQHPDAPVRPNKAGRLLRFRTAVGLLVGELGPDATRSKLHEGGCLSGQLDEQRLAALEAAVQEVVSGELQAPPALTAGLSRTQLAAALADVGDELVQQRSESTKNSWKLGPEYSGEG